MSELRQVVEGIQTQGEDEEITYTLDISAIGSSPTDIMVVAKETAGDSEVTSTVLSGTPVAVSATLIKLPVLKALKRGVEYRIEVKFTVIGQKLEHYFIVKCEE